MLLSNKLFEHKNLIIKKILQALKTHYTSGRINKEVAKQITADFKKKCFI